MNSPGPFQYPTGFYSDDRDEVKETLGGIFNLNWRPLGHEPDEFVDIFPCATGVTKNAENC